MRPSALLSILGCLASTSCSTVSHTLSTDVWLCAYQLGDRYRNETAKPDIVKYDLTVIQSVRRVELTYLLPVEGLPSEQHTMQCESAPWGFGVVAIDGFRLEAPQPDTYPSSVPASNPTVQGRTADTVREAVRETGIHVDIPGIPAF